uniref:Uncharacterized protein n=1 Tax=Anguilla anguilla TaxID=7936 RepID=A0A0E9UDJ0_ANGAN
MHVTERAFFKHVLGMVSTSGQQHTAPTFRFLYSI